MPSQVSARATDNCLQFKGHSCRKRRPRLAPLRKSSWAAIGSCQVSHRSPRLVPLQRSSVDGKGAWACGTARRPLVLPHVDTAAMNLHLAEIGTHVPPDTHAVVILDQAG